MSRQRTAQKLFPETEPAGRPKQRGMTASRANDLDGKEWTKFSISVWNDLRKTVEEAKLAHPAMFPGALVERLIRCFTRESEKVVLDPFCGSGATLVTARKLGKCGIGFEVAEPYYELTLQRLRHAQAHMFGAAETPEAKVYLCDARRLTEHVAPDSVDLCITSPPYWDILSRKRSADYKQVRDYAVGDGDLSRIRDYEQFLEELAVVFAQVAKVLRPGKYCIVVVMDLRKQEKFYPFHADLAARLTREDVGLILDDIVIWDRRHEYNNLRPLGYPSTFRINKVHEYILIFRKPK
jgi:DNA modification methylase